MHEDHLLNLGVEMFLVSMNGESVGVVQGVSLTSAKRWVKKNITSTHMGEWRRVERGFEYATTIGQYFLFVRCGE